MSSPLSRSLRHRALHFHDKREARADAGADAEPNATISIPQAPDLTRREASSSAAVTGPLPTSSSTNTTIPIAVGIVVPLTIALVIFLVLHRRHVKKLSAEDANDRHKSLDFGLSPAGGGKKNRKAGGRQPEMDTNFEKNLRRGHGLSMEIGNPYLLPPTLQGSRESIHSLSRTVPSDNDPYRPATVYTPGGTPIQSFANVRPLRDDASIRTGSTEPAFKQDNMKQGLLGNAQQISRSSNLTQSTQSQSPPMAANSVLEHTVTRKGVPSTGQDADSRSTSRSTSSGSQGMKTGSAGQASQGNDYFGGIALGGGQTAEPADFFSTVEQGHHQDPLPSWNLPYPEEPRTTTNGHNHYQSNDSQSSRAHSQDPYAQDEFVIVKPRHDGSSGYQQPTYHEDHSTPFHATTAYDEPTAGGLGMSNIDMGDHRHSIMPPLPPDDPMDNPEQRANRIRSFYKEYFSENELPRVTESAAGHYYEDYGQEFHGEGTVFDAASGGFVSARPFAEPVARRAMTPPPRGPPRFQGMAHHQHNNSNPGPRQQQRSRAYSSASTGAPYGPGRGQQRRPPPAALRNLPTPHLLQESAFGAPIDFAPPSGYRDRQQGRPSSPFMEQRPYSPSVPVANTLYSSFDELPSMPSPHHLRKSGAFTALDFAPPPRFKERDAASDNGSIRSGRSGRSAVSQAQVQGMRSGVYDVRSIPKALVGSKNEFQDSLRPTWKIGT